MISKIFSLFMAVTTSFFINAQVQRIIEFDHQEISPKIKKLTLSYSSKIDFIQISALSTDGNTYNGYFQCNSISEFEYKCLSDDDAGQIKLTSKPSFSISAIDRSIILGDPDQSLEITITQTINEVSSKNKQ